MLNKSFVQKLRQEHQKKEKERSYIIKNSNTVLHTSKRIIFSLHRGEIEESEKNFSEIEKILKNMEEKFGYKRIIEEGAYKAAVEEYVEAKFFYFLLKNKRIDKIKGIKISFDTYVAGLCDLTGELVRWAVNEVANGNLEKSGEAKKIINDIMAELVQFDLTGYLRTKYDQARAGLKKIEQINYEVQTRK